MTSETVEVLEVKGNNLIIWKSGRKTTVNIDQVREYRPRQTDTISSDSLVETLYDEQEVSHGSNRSNQGQFKEHRKTSSQESEGCRSRQESRGRSHPRSCPGLTNLKRPNTSSPDHFITPELESIYTGPSRVADPEVLDVPVPKKIQLVYV
ncbi:hypothetical protein TNCV_3943661 [Trichonephila clavipes]|nr:hypothetical protein TNCV_3943661 [Trichonephila clavipes]